MTPRIVTPRRLPVIPLNRGNPGNRSRGGGVDVDRQVATATAVTGTRGVPTRRRVLRSGGRRDGLAGPPGVPHRCPGGRASRHGRGGDDPNRWGDAGRCPPRHG